ncbi:MAG: hypothetical protein ABIR00_03925 [Nitrosospira sp.]
MNAQADPARWQAQFEGIEEFHEDGNTNESWYRAAEDLLTDQGAPKWEGESLKLLGIGTELPRMWLPMEDQKLSGLRLLAGENGSVEASPVEERMVERGEGLLKQESTQYVKTPGTNQENRNAITVQLGHIPGSNPGNDIAIGANRDRDRKPVDDGVAKKGGESSDPGYVRRSVSVPAFAGTGRDSKSVQPESSCPTGDHGNVGPEYRAARGVEGVSIADAAPGTSQELTELPGARPLIESLIKRLAAAKQGGKAYPTLSFELRK